MCSNGSIINTFQVLHNLFEDKLRYEWRYRVTNLGNNLLSLEFEIRRKPLKCCKLAVGKGSMQSGMGSEGGIPTICLDGWNDPGIIPKGVTSISVRSAGPVVGSPGRDRYKCISNGKEMQQVI